MKMSDKKEAGIAFDRFSEYMQQRLANHRTPLEAGGWEALEAKMQKRHRLKLLRTGAGIAAAALLALTLLNVPWGRKEDASFLSPEAVMEAVTETIPEAVSERQTEAPASPSLLPAPAVVRPAASVPHPAVAQAEAPVDAPQPPAPNESEAAETAGETAEQKPEQKATSSYRQPYNPRPTPTPAKKGNKWLIAAAFGSGGGFAPGMLGSGNDMAYDNAPQVNAPENDGNYATAPILPPEYEHILPDFADATSSIPLSFGIMVRRNLSRQVALESGLVYTYLLTKFEKPTPARYDARLELHYLGIPLRLVAYLWNDPKWTVYVAGGLMAEKGLRSVYTQQRYVAEGIHQTRVTNAIDRMQWSMSGSAGVSYRVYKDWSLYAEPRLSYYFEAGQPVSTRTEHPLSFELGAGIRYEF
jgi:hypothetical protein